MAVVRHSDCRIDFDPADVTSRARVTVTDPDDGLVCIDVKITHLLAAVSKMSMVLVRRDAAIARIIGEMDDEVKSKQEFIDLG